MTRYETLPGTTDVVYSTIREAFTSTVLSVQPGRTIYETSVVTEEGDTLTATLSSVETITVSSCSIPIGPVTPPVVLTRTLPGVTYTSFVTAPEFNNSVVVTSTQVITAPGGQTTVTEYETETVQGSTFTAPGGETIVTEYETKTAQGSTFTAPGESATTTEWATRTVPGENSTITSTETTTCYETVTATPEGPVSPARETTICATSYITKDLPAAYTVSETCSDATVTITASKDGWGKPGGYGPHSTATGDWGDDKPSGYGDPVASSTGYWRRR